MSDWKLSKCVSKSEAAFPAETNKAPKPAIAPEINPTGPNAMDKAAPRPEAAPVAVPSAVVNPPKEVEAPRIFYPNESIFPDLKADIKPVKEFYAEETEEDNPCKPFLAFSAALLF